ncbi:YdeI/OmpD-associated family protein [Caulobacter sp. 1776]|uniref:YdeI/OmpD-associated family protein n=1 Tax=Caulobacter sp. 1776 TaxID=3156420 RepID=UPI0033935BF1
MTSLRFKARIEINGINPFVPLDAEQAARLREGWRKPMPVRVQVNGAPAEPWRINMMPRGDGGFFLYLHGEVREAAGVGVGDTVDVEVTFDEAYRGGPAHPMPEAFAHGLRHDPAAAKAWDALTPSLRKEALRRFASVKSEQARTRNIEAALAVLGGASGRFMAREWKDGAVV